MIRQPTVRTAALLALVVWAPVPFGSVTARAASALVAATFAAAALALLSEGSRSLARETRLVLAALVAIAALGALQLVPLPAGLGALASPEHGRLARAASAAFGVGEPRPVALTLDRDATRDTLALWAMAAAALLAAALHAPSRRARRSLLAALVGAALFQVLFGAAQWTSGKPTLWGVTVPYTPRLRGSFVNPNHFALLLEIALAVVFAWLWWCVRRQVAETGRSGSVERRIASIAPAALIWLLLFAGLAFTGSRAGFVASLAATALQIALTARGGRRWAAVGGAAVVAVGLGTVALWGAEAGFGRLARLVGSSPMRVESATAAIALWTKFPLFGCGLGGFRAGFPLVAERDPGGTLWHAHSDWLELAATGGAVALLLLAAGLAVAVRRLLTLWRLGERSEDRAAPLAALGALAAVALHELVDFGLTMPANALLLAVVCGAALAVPVAVQGAATVETHTTTRKANPAPLAREPRSES